MRAVALGFCAVLGLLGAFAPARAQDATFQYRLEDRLPKGQPAALVLMPVTDVRDVVLTLRSGKSKAVHRLGSMAAGEQKRVEWKPPAGVSQWSAELTGRSDAGAVKLGFDFRIASVDPLEVRLRPSDVALAEGRVIVVPSRVLVAAEVQVRDVGGDVVVDTKVDVTGSVPGQPTTVEWMSPSGVEPRRVDLKLIDELGFWTLLRAVSWHADIAHEEVEFETAKWEIRPAEAPKLDRAIAELHKELERFRSELGADAAVDAACYIGGYTDTVGNPADNQLLSERRARAIGEYFRANGVKLPIHYQGFGEGALAVPTADDVDEARNRRAVYVLGNAPPSGRDFPRPAWKRLGAN